MAVHSVLRPKDYVRFDASNKKHREMYGRFVVEGRWPDDTRFMLEDPFGTVPAMCDRKLIQHFLFKEGSWPTKERAVA
jgi:hypothetical protein